MLPSRTRIAITGFLDELRGPNYREALRRYVATSLFISTDDRRRKERIVKSMVAAPQHVVVPAFESLCDYDPTVAAAGLAVPGLYIAADELRPRSDMNRFHEMFPEILYGKAVGSGHFCQLEVPEQVNSMIERFLAFTLPGRTSVSSAWPRSSPF